MVRESYQPFFLADFEFTLGYMRKHLNKYMNCFNGQLNAGKIKLVQCSFFEKKQFIDYIYGGLDISTMVAIDSCIANGNPQDEGSLHYVGSWQSNVKHPQ